MASVKELIEKGHDTFVAEIVGIPTDDEVAMKKQIDELLTPIGGFQFTQEDLEAMIEDAKSFV